MKRTPKDRQKIYLLGCFYDDMNYEDKAKSK